MPQTGSDRNLLFGILALQMDFISRDALIAAMNRWVLEKHTPLGQLLLQQKAITSDTHALVEALVQKHAANSAKTADAAPNADEDSYAATMSVGAFTSTGQRFRVLRPHAKGGIGEVFFAHDEELRREVALKEIQQRHAADKASRSRFVQEAEITGGLEHPGIVPVYGVGQHPDGRPYYAMRFIRGRTLSQAVKELHQKRRAGEDVALELPMLLHAFVVVCNTIGYAHSRGVIHRDLKGSNVILGNFGEVVVLDWGLAKVIGTPDPSDGGSSLAEKLGDSDLSVSGQLLGTPAYMAPEQAAGQLEHIDRCTDIYGLGAILYEILTGRPPFADRSLGELLRKIQVEPPTPPRQIWPEVAPGLEAVCLRALAKKPEDRYAGAKELADAVQQWQEAERRQAGEALRASEEKYRSLADLIPGVVWTAAADGAIDYANQFWFDYTGMTWPQTHGNGWAAAVHPDDLSKAVQYWTKALQSGDPYEVEYRIKRADGAYRWFLAQARTLCDRDGRVVKWFGMLTEIDDRKLMEEELARTAQALRDSEAQFRLLADAIPQIVWSKRPDGSNEYLNERWFQYSGQLSEASLSSRWGWAEILHPDDLQRTQELWNRAMQTGEGFEIEYRLRRQSDGAYRWHLGRALPVRDIGGHIIRWFGTCTDIEDQKRVEECLRASEERYRLLADAIPQNVWTAHPDGSLDYVNQRSSDYHGTVEHLGDAWQRVVHPDDLPRCQEQWAASLQSGETYQVEFRLRGADGQFRWYLARAVPVRNDAGAIVKWFGTNTDIDDRKRAEEELSRIAEALRISEERYRSLADAIPQIVWTTNPEGSNAYLNERWFEYTGLTPEQSSGYGWMDVVHEDDKARTLDVWAQARDKNERFEMEYRLRRADGAYRWHLGLGMPLRNADGRIVAWFGTCTDIHDRKISDRANP